MTVREAVAGDGTAFAPLLQESDLAELEATLGVVDPGRVLEAAIRRGECTYIAEIGGVPAAIFGVASRERAHEREYARVWMLGTDELPRHPRALMRAARAWLPKLLKGARGWNLVDERKLRTLRVLLHLGAHLYRSDTERLADPEVAFIPFHVEPDGLGTHRKCSRRDRSVVGGLLHRR